MSCRNCPTGSVGQDKGRREKLCAVCYDNCQKDECMFCRLDCRRLAKDGPRSTGGLVPCASCESGRARHGQPRTCSVCTLLCAFSSGPQAAQEANVCKICAYGKKHHGEPMRCVSCSNRRAFNKSGARTSSGAVPGDSKAQCYWCEREKKKKRHEGNSGSAGGTSTGAVSGSGSAQPHKRHRHEVRAADAGVSTVGAGEMMKLRRETEGSLAKMRTEVEAAHSERFGCGCKEMKESSVSARLKASSLERKLEQEAQKLARLESESSVTVDKHRRELERLKHEQKEALGAKDTINNELRKKIQELQQELKDAAKKESAGRAGG